MDWILTSKQALPISTDHILHHSGCFNLFSCERLLNVQHLTCTTKVQLVCLGFSALSAGFSEWTVKMRATSPQAFY